MFADWLRKHLRHKELGWPDIKEEFTRYQLLKTRWFNIYLHRLYAPILSPDCHDHPWWFITLLLWNGYLESNGKFTKRRWPGMILYRPAEFIHNVVTPYGVSWSLILAGPKSRDWGFKPCQI